MLVVFYVLEFYQPPPQPNKEMKNKEITDKELWEFQEILANRYNCSSKRKHHEWEFLEKDSNRNLIFQCNCGLFKKNY